MNTIDEIALRVAEKLEPRGRTYSPDHYIEFASALLAELSKESKPHCWKCEATIAEQATEISKLISAVADHVTVRAEQRQQLADEQSKVKVLTDALEEAKKYSAIWPQHIDRLIDEALATVKEERCPKT